MTSEGITIYRRDGTVAFHSETATTVAEAAGESRADLRGADLRDADLWGADLWDADLRDADLWGANLRGADLRDANLRGADLWGANLRDANLRGADLRNADLWGANLILAGTDTRGYLWYATYSPDGGLLVQAGCRRFTLAEAHAHWDGEHPHGEIVGAECRARLAMIEAVAKAKGWVE